MKRSIPRGHVSPAFSRKLRGIGSRRHDASQKRLWKINVLPADVSAGVRSFVYSLSPFPPPTFLPFSLLFSSTGRRIYRSRSRVFRFRKEDGTNQYLFFLFPPTGRRVISFTVDTKIFRFRKGRKEWTDECTGRSLLLLSLLSSLLLLLSSFKSTRRFHSDDRVGGRAGKKGFTSHYGNSV